MLGFAEVEGAGAEARRSAAPRSEAPVFERVRATMLRPEAEPARGKGDRGARGAGSGPGAGPSAALAPAPCPYPDPFDDPDTIEALEERILVLATHIEVAGHRLLEMVAEFDRRRGWELGGHSSCAHWLAARGGLDLGTAREKVRVARALEELPETSAWLGLGRISFSQARALTRVATPEDEGELLEATSGMTTAQIERLVRGWRMRSAADAVAREEERQRMRCFSVVPELDGMYRVRGWLTPEQGALLMRAIEAAGDVLFREETHGQAHEARVQLPPGARLAGDRRSDARLRREAEATAARRRADAVALLAEVALGAGFGARKAGGEGAAQEGAAPEETDAASAEPRAGAVAPLSGTRAGRYQVMLHVELDALRQGDPTCGAGCSHLDDGVRVSAETSRRISCDAAVVPLFLDAEGRLAELGERRRVVNPALRRALEARDRGCRFPGCGLRYTEAHHVRHWADGGATSLENCVLLCRHHHRLLHEGGWRMEVLPGERLLFRDRKGRAHYDGRWHLPRLDDERRLEPARTLMEENLRIIVEGATGTPADLEPPGTHPAPPE